jgi:hypothetical protein
MTTVATQAELQTQIARQVFERFEGTAWVRATLFFAEVGGASTSVADGRGADGGEVVQKRGARIRWGETFSQLKRLMADPVKGAWISSEMTLTREGKFTFTFNYDRRVYWYGSLDTPYDPPTDQEVHPGVDSWREEFENFPRDPAYLPDWAPAASQPTSQLNGSSQTPELLERALAMQVGLPPNLAGLAEHQYWLVLVDDIEVELKELFQGELYRDLLVEVQDHGRAYDGLWQDVLASVAPLLELESTEPLSPTELELWRGLASVSALDDRGRAEQRRELFEAIVEIIGYQIDTRLAQ